jgi:hypothetical protein
MTIERAGADLNTERTSCLPRPLQSCRSGSSQLSTRLVIMFEAAGRQV